jgi:hypothetical protein
MAGYETPFAAGAATVPDEIIQAYMAQQAHNSDDVFRIEGEASPRGDPSDEGPPPRL